MRARPINPPHHRPSRPSARRPPGRMGGPLHSRCPHFKAPSPSPRRNEPRGSARALARRPTQVPARSASRPRPRLARAACGRCVGKYCRPVQYCRRRRVRAGGRPPSTPPIHPSLAGAFRAGVINHRARLAAQHHPMAARPVPGTSGRSHRARVLYCTASLAAGTGRP